MLLPISGNILKDFEAVLAKKAIALPLRADYRKWLRYFLDFRAKYHPPDARSEQVRLFMEKLHEKKQTSDQQEQAALAVSLFFRVAVAKDVRTGDGNACG